MAGRASLSGLLAAVLASLPALAAEPSEPAAAHRYTLADCLRLGLERAVPVQNAKRDERIAEARIGEVRAQVLPSLKAHGGYTRLADTYSFDTGQGQIDIGRLNNYTASAELSQLLYDGGSVSAALGAARLYRARAAEGTRMAQAARARDIRVAFYGVLLAAQTVAVEEAALGQLRGLVAQAEAKFQHEAASEFDRLSARVRLANEQPVLIRARLDAQVARAALRNLLVLDEPAFELDGELAFAPSAVSLALAQDFGRLNRPEILQQHQRIGLDQADVRVEQGGYFPELRARAAYNGQDPEDVFSSRDSWDWRWEAGLTAEWSLFDGQRRQHVLRQKTLELEKSRADLGEIERAVALEIEEAYLELTHAAEAVAASRETAGPAERGLELAKARYAASLSTYLDFADTNLALRTARLAQARALCEHLQALARLDYACGRPPPVEGKHP